MISKYIFKNCFFTFLMVAATVTTGRTVEPERTVLPKADKKVIKAIVVYEDPKLEDGRYLHQLFGWNNPRELNRQYKDFFFEQSGGVVEYEIVNEIETDLFWTHYKQDPERKSWDLAEVVKLFSEPGWATLRKEERAESLSGDWPYKYKEMIEHYGFDKMRDRDEVHEIWVWSYPISGMYESRFAGQGAFWLNSPPMNPNTTNEKLLIVMGFNYERDVACAVEDFGHRAESIMKEVYGRWNWRPSIPSAPNNWELYSAFDGVSNGSTHVGNVHFPPNGRKDYDWANPASVKSYHKEWQYYPNIRKNEDEGAKGEIMDCSAWGCNHLGWFKFWFSHFPNFQGINKKDGKLNNWWHYFVDYQEARKLEKVQ